LGFGEASAKTHARSGLQLSRNEAKTQKDRFFLSPPEWLQHFLNRSRLAEAACLAPQSLVLDFCKIKSMKSNLRQFS
jgi:hypothetical protein